MQQAENEGDYTSRLAMMEELKSMPFAAVWDFHCLRSEVPQGIAWLERVRKYESDVLARRH
jgi:L-rhamnose isomerase